MTHEALADGFDVVRRRHARGIPAQIVRVRSFARAVADARVRRDRTRERVDDHRQRGVGGNVLSPVLWVVAVIAVATLEALLGRYVVSLLAPDEPDGVVAIATAAVAAIVFTVGHLAGSAIRSWIEPTDAEPATSSRRRSAVAVLSTSALVLLLIGALAAVDAEPGRWVLSAMAVFGAIVVQIVRPNHDTTLYVFESLRLMRASLVLAVTSRRAHRAGHRLAIDHHRVSARWAAQVSIAHAAAAQNGRDTSLPAVAGTRRHQQHLQVLGLAVTYDEVVAALDELLAAGVVVDVAGPDLRMVA